jgi:hypothetical protein
MFGVARVEMWSDLNEELNAGETQARSGCEGLAD